MTSPEPTLPEPTPAQPAAPGSIRRKRPARQQFASTILLLEAFLVLFATLVAYGLANAGSGPLPPSAVWVAGGVLMLVLVVLSRMPGRPGGYVAGSVVQVVVLAMGFVVPMMFVVGGVFVVLWVVSLRLGGRIDRERAEWDAAHPGQVSG
ncbi:DUF4233 domain-containing protein [Cellulomonas cellasea]|uniref:Flp pilus assembly protein TadB n=1 Tax=Cellulomonas cellasea TaxID=43670 RepID=A0A7W4YCH2_9CELL|nr:DUF4233 domain-containing protein [Cellulomonas cellasea]MBB2925000.1 Flp pilus assembly protein TadB [Cellulomonas cellasea]